jgi:hypothetical protein
MHVELPHTLDEQQLAETTSFKETFDPAIHVGLFENTHNYGLFLIYHQILASSPPLSPPPLILFEACLSNLWSIWECVVLCEPILIFGPSPAFTSQAVWWFRDLLRPVRP